MFNFQGLLRLCVCVRISKQQQQRLRGSKRKVFSPATSKGARYETPTISVSGVYDAAPERISDELADCARRDARPRNSRSRNGSLGTGRAQTKSESEWKVENGTREVH